MILDTSARELDKKAQTLNLPALGKIAKDYFRQSEDLDRLDWNKQRKGLSEYNYEMQNQQLR